MICRKKINKRLARIAVLFMIRSNSYEIMTFLSFLKRFLAAEFPCSFVVDISPSFDDLRIDALEFHMRNDKTGEQLRLYQVYIFKLANFSLPILLTFLDNLLSFIEVQLLHILFQNGWWILERGIEAPKISSLDTAYDLPAIVNVRTLFKGNLCKRNGTDNGKTILEVR